jgi:hypothetical protein
LRDNHVCVANGFGAKLSILHHLWRDRRKNASTSRKTRPDELNSSGMVAN